MSKKCPVSILLSTLTVLLAVSGCVSYRSLARDSVNYNLAVERGQNQMLLINIIRASKRYPLYLTSIAKVTGSNSASVSIEAAIPFGKKMDSNTVTPGGSFEVNPTFDVPVLDSQEFTNGFLTPIKTELLDYYWDQGWSQEMLMHILVSQVRMTVTPKAGGDSTDYYLFNHPHSEDERLCELEKFSRWVNLFLAKGDPSFEEVEATGYIGPNLGRDAVGQLKDLIELGKSESLDLEEVQNVPNQFRLRRPKSKHFLVIAQEGAQEIYDWTKGAAKDACSEYESEEQDISSAEGRSDNARQVSMSQDLPVNKGVDNIDITLFLRSPEAVLYYLGQLLRVEESDRVPRICIGGKIEPLFVARIPKSGCPGERSVSVRYEGNAYNILGGLGKPIADQTCEAKNANRSWASQSNSPLHQKVLDCNSGRSMHTLSLLTQLINLQKSAKDLPVTTTVRTVGQ